ncbi:DUF802 domain-containing protein [Caballeronia sp. BR00000012568055]|uniref:DUF802 domain-containing protein n=1 Tax=Caballeronia sp. BR00000012568055 TaxID=2918761 RepID=UPI0023FA3445|nr:DUF802 domain-containing protein [Caballeronia sp. BR00000012568055]
MPRYLLNVAVFLAGLAAVCGIAVGYIGSNFLALAVTLLIGACYLAGASELQRYQQTTQAFARVLDALHTPPKSLGVWLENLPATLRNAVRLRVEGERSALPGPALTPYLVGLLVLLGMLGTLLGMVVTLRGTGAALESATDLSAIRSSLAAPVTGLSFAFGTSIAGVATSAMLGLLSALCRRERMLAAQTLDLKISTTLRSFTPIHQREESFRLMQRQADIMPKLAERLDAMMHAIEQHSMAANERQIVNQDAFHAKTETAYRRLANSVEQSLKQSVADSARAASAALQPIMQTTMDGIARETAALQGKVEQAVAQQLDGLKHGFEASTEKVADIWTRSLDGHRQSNANLVDGVAAQIGALNAGFESMLAKHAESSELQTQAAEQRADRLIDNVATQVGALNAGFESMLSKHAQSSDALVTKMDASTDRFAEQHAQAGEAIAARMNDALQRIAQSFDERSTTLIDGVASRLETTSSGLSQTWRDALTQQTQAGETLAAQHEKALNKASANFEHHAASLLNSMDRSHADLRTELAANHEARLTAWNDSLAALASTLREEWQAANASTAAHQKQICDTLEQTASNVSAQTEAHAKATIAQIEGLVQTASEAPKAAAEVIAELRQQLSDSMVRDTAMLDERARLLSTLETLLDAVNHASKEQRVAVDALVASSADLLERVGTQFTDKVETETARLGEVAAHVTGSAVEVASLSDAFGSAVQAFGTSNELLVTQLQRIEGALDKSLARSDEQLAYYVAQAREVIDLSLMSQKQIVEDLQHIAAQRATGARAA